MGPRCRRTDLKFGNRGLWTGRINCVGFLVPLLPQDLMAFIVLRCLLKSFIPGERLRLNGERGKKAGLSILSDGQLGLPHKGTQHIVELVNK